ncbi:MAG: hypothetical protein C0617_13445 [Desulfuromonas sp.]|uniref:alpha/beta fold hydrolase n=1 Tax=Desulfuromonas sp. TaxID=892 RepID=UPI000CCB464F|nr:alpha/beta fold hydrolase [Desulfuromonas sp.]PLX82868.1 MAG: hypothetical protein C0617_13445 [Desulfuromonas sp.]
MRYRLPDGRLLAYREAGAGPPLVLLHGWAMSSAVFGEALEEFADRFRVLVPDLPGHGASDPGTDCSPEGFARYLAAWIEGLGLQGAALVGWSLGGQVLLKLYPAVACRVERVILASSTPRFTAGRGWEAGLPPGQVKSMARNLKRRFRETIEEFFALQFQGEDFPPGRYGEIVDFALRSARPPRPEAAMAALEGLAGGDLRGAVAEVGCPALVVHGALDRIIPADAGRCLAEHLPGGRLVLLPDAGHAPFLSHPRQSFGLWRKFLS